MNAPAQSLNVVRGADLFSADAIRAEFAAGPPVRFATCEPFEWLDLRPGRLVVLGGQPGTGKTAAMLQAIVDALAMNPDLRAVIGNIEMSPEALRNRILSRIADVDLTAIDDGKTNITQQQMVLKAAEAAADVLERLDFIREPFTVRHLYESAKAFGARLVVCDYLQKFRVEASDEYPNEQAAVQAVMPALRVVASDGLAVLALAAIHRQPGSHGSSYDSPGLASFRGSSEVEYSADLALTLSPSSIFANAVAVNVAKNRFGRIPDAIHLAFDGSRQSFASMTPDKAFDAAQPKPPRKPKASRKQEEPRILSESSPDETHIAR